MFPIVCPCVIGKMGKLVYTPTELVQQIQVMNGRMEVLISLYGVASLNNTTPDWSTAIIDKIMLEGSGFEWAKPISDFLASEETHHVVVWDGGQRWYVIVTVEPKRLGMESLETANKVLLERGYKRDELNWKLDKKVHFPGTWNPRTKSWVLAIPLSILGDYKLLQEQKKRGMPQAWIKEIDESNKLRKPMVIP